MKRRIPVAENTRQRQMSHRWKTLKISSHIFFSRRLYFDSARLISHGWVCVQSRTFLTYYWIIVSCRCRSTEPALDCDSLRHHDWHWCSHMRNRPEPKANATYILWASSSFSFFHLRIKRLLTSAKILHLFCVGRVFLDRLSPSSRYLSPEISLEILEHATRDSQMRYGDQKPLFKCSKNQLVYEAFSPSESHG